MIKKYVCLFRLGSATLFDNILNKQGEVKMKTQLISISVLFALSSTVFAERYRGHDIDYNQHHSSGYVFSYGKYPEKPFRYYKKPNHYGEHNRFDRHKRHITRRNHHKNNLPVIIFGAGILGYILANNH